MTVKTGQRRDRIARYWAGRSRTRLDMAGSFGLGCFLGTLPAATWWGRVLWLACCMGLTDYVATVLRWSCSRGAATVQPEAAEPGLPFDIKSLEFQRGVEFGLLFAEVKDCGRAEMTVHADMTELVMRLAESRDLPFSGKPHEHDEHCPECTGRSDCKDGGEWLDVTIG